MPPDALDFPTLLDEAAGPFTARVGTLELVIDPPTSGTVCDLDTAGPAGQLELLAGGEAADAVLGELDDAPAHELTELVDDAREHFGILLPPPGGMARVVEEIDLYGEAIEYDLLQLPARLMLHDFVREHLRYPWALLLRMLARLPQGGHYRAAQALDPETAEEVLALQRDGKLPRCTGGPPLVGWTDERETQLATLETLRRIEHGVWAASPKFKGKGGEPPGKLPRPRTALDAARGSHLLVRHDAIGAKLLGSRYRAHSHPGRMPAPEAVRGAVLLDPPDTEWR